MKKAPIFFLFIILTLISCSTGKKALQKGDYFSALTKAVERLKSAPNNKNATKVLKEGYPTTLNWINEELDQIQNINAQFKWESAINIMEQANHLSSEIRKTPAARNIIANPKSFTSELNSIYTKAANDRYNAGTKELDLNTRESARMAYEHFKIADNFVTGYKDTRNLMEISKEIATVKVVLETIPVSVSRYQLSSEFFYDQVFEFLNNQFNQYGFVNFFTPFQAEKENLIPDYIINLEFFDFSVGNLTHSEKEENAEKRVKIDSRDSTKIQYRTYKAKIKLLSDQVVSGGSLRSRIFEPATDKLLFDEIIPGTFTWVNQYAIFVGDEEALDNKQLRLTKRSVLPLPNQQDLFIDFTRPIYDQLTQKLSRFFSRF